MSISTVFNGALEQLTTCGARAANQVYRESKVFDSYIDTDPFLTSASYATLVLVGAILWGLAYLADLPGGFTDSSVWPVLSVNIFLKTDTTFEHPEHRCLWNIFRLSSTPSLAGIQTSCSFARAWRSVFVKMRTMFSSGMSTAIQFLCRRRTVDISSRLHWHSNVYSMWIQDRISLSLIKNAASRRPSIVCLGPPPNLKSVWLGLMKRPHSIGAAVREAVFEGDRI